MYKLIKNNIERIVESETMRDKFIADGFVLLVEKEEIVAIDKKKKVTKKLG